MGGYLYGQMLRHLLANRDINKQFTPTIKAQVFDSPPDFSGIAKGISQSMGVGMYTYTLCISPYASLPLFLYVY